MNIKNIRVNMECIRIVIKLFNYIKYVCLSIV
jgi:hypothetical protein